MSFKSGGNSTYGQKQRFVGLFPNILILHTPKEQKKPIQGKKVGLGVST
jgi:hypothetical protein